MRKAARKACYLLLLENGGGIFLRSEGWITFFITMATRT
jgi:hypothetical protein